MKLRILRYLVLLVLTAAGCGGGSGDSGASSSAGGSGFKSGTFTLSAPAAQASVDISEFIFLDVQVNGTSGRFILDTGADSFVVSTAFADRAGLERTGDTRIITIAGSAQAPVRRIADFRFANVIGTDIDAAELDLQGLDGIVGLPFFKAVVVALDYSGRTLDLADPALVNPQQLASDIGGRALQAPDFVLSGVTVDGEDVGPLRIDTGNSGGLRVSAAEGGALANQAVSVMSVSSSASNGTVPGVAFIAQDTQLGGFSLPSQFVVVQDLPLDIGLIGSLVLQQFYIVFDLSKETVVLRQERELRYQLSSEAGTGRRTAAY